MSSDSGKATTCFLFMIGFGVYSFFTGFSKLRKKRMVENLPTSKIRGMAMGTVEIIGKTEKFRSPLTAPFSAKPCVYFKYEIEEYRKSGKNSHWVTIKSGDSAITPFFVNDGTGRVLVSPTKAEMILPSDLQTTSWRGTPIESSLRRLGIKSSGFLGLSKRLRFTEWHIQPGEQVYVLGYAAKNNNYLISYREELAHHLKVVRRDLEKMKKFDLNHDGQISQSEWEMAKNSIKKEFLEEQMNKKGPDEHFDVVVQYNPNAKMFLISDKDQKTLLKTLGWQVLWSIWGGAALAVLGLFLLMLQFNWL